MQVSSFGYKATTMDQVARLANVGKGTIYTFFKNKEELFSKATRRYIEEFAKARLPYLHEAGVPLPLRLRNFMKSVVTMHCNEEGPKGCFMVL